MTPDKGNEKDSDETKTTTTTTTTTPSKKASTTADHQDALKNSIFTTSSKEEIKSPSPPRPPIAPSVATTPTALPSPSPSYISSASSPSPTSGNSGARPFMGSFGVESGERSTIDSEATTILRKDSDDVSLSNIKPVHNFFSQQQQYGYDSDGSDGSLVFSPASMDDHKSMVVTGSATKKGAIGKRKEPPANASSPFSNRDRTQSTDSQSSIKYISKSSQHPPQASVASEPVNPQMLPYHERRKLMQQKQKQTQPHLTDQQMQQMQQQQQYQYQVAMMMHAQQQQQQQQMAQNQQGQSPQTPPHHPAQMYAMDPRMAAAYYQMYGIAPPPPPAAMYPASHSPHGSGVPSQIGYPFSSPPPGAYLSPSHQPQPMQPMPHHQQHGSGSGYAPYPPSMQYQHYPGFHMAGGQPMMPPSYGYMPNPQPPPGQPVFNPQQVVMPQRSIQQQPPQPLQQQQDPAVNDGKQDKSQSIQKAAVSASGKPPASHIKNPLRPPTNAGSGKPPNPAHRKTSSMSGGAPPPPPPLPPPSQGASHFRAESYGSMSSLGSHGATGISASSFSKDDDDDIQHSRPPPPPPPPPKPQTPPQQQQEKSGSTALTASKQGKSSTGALPPAPTTPQSKKRTIDIGANSIPTPESPRDTTHARKDSFLDRIRMNWSPQSRPSTSSVNRKKPNVHEFHRKNQEFLQRNTLVPTFPSSNVTPGMMHRRLGSQDRPPASRGTHRRLQSISNDEWDEDTATSGDDRKMPAQPPFSGANQTQKPTSIARRFDFEVGEDTSDSASGYYDDSRFTSDSAEESQEEANERTALLPPSGISTNEQDERDSHYGRGSRYTNQNYVTAASGRRHQRKASRSAAPTPSSPSIGDSSTIFPKDSEAAISATEKWDNRTAQMFKNPKKKKYRRKSSKRKSADSAEDESSSDSDPNSSEEEFDYRQWTKERARMLEKERSKLIQQWKAEARAEAESMRKEEQSSHCWRLFAARFNELGNEMFRLSTLIEAFIGNLPLTIGAVAMAVVTLGVVWFKFAEEFLDSCEPVHFHSSQCTFPEFPGCFYCDTTATGYKIAIGFHYGCKIVSGFLALVVVAKIILATRVVMDEMSSPTTSSPAGLLCMTAVCVFAGRGLIGQIVVSSAACIHLCLAIWFIYMALAYHIMPEPSWFPNTVGIGISAVKTWLYYPMPGHLLMAISLSLNFFFFPISLIRVAVNKKISATVGWMQMSAPAISLYALTIMAQPSFEEEHPDVTNFQRVHRMVYLPCMHVMCALSILGMVASVHSLLVRWHDFKTKEFSPAHAAFCFPTLSHANAIQAYRGAVRSFSDIPSGTWRMFLLDGYWFMVLMGGTIATFWICGKFILKLPEWTSPDLSDEEEPPAPYDTLMSQQHMVTAGDALTQPFVSPAILQANETGALILTRARDGTLRYVRTRRVGAFGFEPTMNWSEMQQEREVLLEWVGKHPPRRRHRTLSVPGIDFSYGASLGTGNFGVYGSASPLPQSRRRFMSQGGDRALY